MVLYDKLESYKVHRVLLDAQSYTKRTKLQGPNYKGYLKEVVFQAGERTCTKAPWKPLLAHLSSTTGTM